MDFSTKKIDELRLIAKEKGIKGIAKYKKQELIELLLQQEAEGQETIQDKETEKAPVQEKNGHILRW